eukprot:802030_1
MSSLALIDEMLNHLGGTSTSTTTETDESNKTTNDIDTKDDDTKSNECDLITDTTLTLRGIPEFENYAHSSTDKFLFMADITAPLFKKKLNRAAIDLVCVLDESGSMDGDRIKLVKQTVEFIIKNLESTDRFGIIGFSSKSREILPLTLMNTNGKENALNECNKIKASGQTALCAGLIDGIQMLKKRNKENKNTIASVMLFTDGQANTGITNKIKILNQMDKYMFDNNNNNNNTIQLKNKKQLQKGEGEMDDDNEGKNEDENENIFSCSISTFGFGKDHNDTLLQEIAERGNGMYSFIETAEYISETFAEALGGLISICGQNLFVNIKALNGVIINKCKSKRFKKKTIIKGKQMQIIIPDIQSEEKRSLLFELTIPSMINNENDTNDMDDMDDMDEFNNELFKFAQTTELNPKAKEWSQASPSTSTSASTSGGPNNKYANSNNKLLTIDNLSHDNPSPSIYNEIPNNIPSIPSPLSVSDQHNTTNINTNTNTQPQYYNNNNNGNNNNN